MDKPGGKKRRLGSEGDLESGSINLRKVLNDRVENVGVRVAPLRPPNEEQPSSYLLGREARAKDTVEAVDTGAVAQ